MAIDKRSQIRRIQALMVKYIMGDFFGELLLKFEHGNIVFVKEICNIKPVDQPVEEVVSKYLNDSNNTDALESSEILLKKIKGKPHITKITKGNIEELASADVLNEAEKFRP